MHRAIAVDCQNARSGKANTIRFWIRAVSLVLGVLSSHPVFAQLPRWCEPSSGTCLGWSVVETRCYAPAVTTEETLVVLTQTLRPGTMGRGTFAVERTDGPDSSPVGFDVSYVVSGKPISAAYVAKGSELWAAGWLLDVRTSETELNLIWNRADSSEPCKFTITTTLAGFKTTRPLDVVITERTNDLSQVVVP
jgi:hypothetical protein